MNYIGIDIGTSNIKIIEVNEKLEIKNKKIFEKINPNSALKEFINLYNINLNNVKQIAITGVGTDNFEENLYNIPAINVPEFIAIGNLGKIILENEDCIITSAGTGTAFIKSQNKTITHEGGTGVGGGTLINLCKIIEPNINFDQINCSIEKGNLENVDLRIKDVTTATIETLPADTTAANFGKLSNKATNNDIILGIVNMIFETIGVMAALIAKGNKINKIIVIGQITKIPYAREVLNKIEKLHNVEFLIPENAEYATAIGAVKYCI